MRIRAPKSSRKVSAVLARVDSEVPSNRSKGARNISPVSVCETSCVIGGALRELLGGTAAAPLFFPNGDFFPAWIYSK